MVKSTSGVYFTRLYPGMKKDKIFHSYVSNK